MPVRFRALLAVLACTALLGSACTDDGGDEPGAGDDAPEPTVLGEGSTYEATIRRTEGGVPHITADDVESLSFGQGWASAEDRACDLADQVVKVTSQRARWFGTGDDDEHLHSDLAWRSIGIAERSRADWETSDDDVRSLITAYTDGWNAHLEEVGADGLDGWCAGAEWVQELEPVDVYTYARSIALQASSGAVAGYLATAEPPGADDGTGDRVAAPAPGSIEPVVASNGWAIGAERSQAGGGMLVANPHFPWEGELRFWEVHLTVPGEVDIYGAQLSGLPGVGIGFTEEFGWTHTVSAGNRFTAYRLELEPGSPTTYRYGDETREMEPVEHTIEVLGDDGEVTEQTFTRWRSHYGPILDFPGVGWTDEATITYRDANLDNDEFVEQYLQMMTARDLDELIEVHREVTGVPLFNTIATSADGRAWYADTSATPNLSDEAIAAYREALDTEFITAAARGAGAVLLDGSDPRFEWQEVEGARDPGLVPYSEMPVVERDDYVFNANDSFWMPHATELLEGDFSPLHGEQRTARSPRTRENATVLDDTSDEGPSGDDGRFSLDELADASLANQGFTARVLLDGVVERCDGAPPVSLEPLVDEGDEVLPGGEVDLTQACEVLAGWDGVYDLDRTGPPLWRELLSRYESADFREAGALFAEPFDPDDPLGTPAVLAPVPQSAEGVDPLLERLARAVQVLEAAELAPDVTLGEVQVAVRGDEVVPIHGGMGVDGTPNVVGWGRSWSTLDPVLAALEREPVAPGSSLATVEGDTTTTGYRINNGTSFLLALEYGEDGPRAKVMLTYGNTENRDDPAYVEATERFSRKEWRDVRFHSEDVERAAEATVVVRG